jgi:hypothetical protein
MGSSRRSVPIWPSIPQPKIWLPGEGFALATMKAPASTIAVRPERAIRGLRRVLCQAAWAASHTRNTYLSAQYHRLAAKRNKNRAIIAVAHSILIIAYFMIKTGEEYRESGGNYFERINAAGLKRYFVKRLEHLGHKVMLEAIPNGA